MRTVRGKVVETQMESGGQVSLRIACPEGVSPTPGRYVSAFNPNAPDDALAVSLFGGGGWGEKGFVAAPPVPADWLPGTELILSGPLGNGFQLPTNTRRLALAAFGSSPSRLVPLMEAALRSGIETTLFSDQIPVYLPTALEVYPLAGLKDAVNWADFLAVDLPLVRLHDLHPCLGVDEQAQFPVPGQVLIYTAMPCRGMAQCGACAVPGKRKRLLACEDGPVFDLKALEW